MIHRGWLGVMALCASGMGAMAMAGSLPIQVSGPAGEPVAGAVVFLDSADAARRTRPWTSAEVVQRQKAFVPDVLVIPRGTSVQFPNQDTVRHHVYSFSPAKKFELKLYVGTPANPVVFDQPGVVVLGCNIHDQMVGWILVVDTPHHTQTGSDGHALLKDVPDGTYTLRVWDKRLPVGTEALAQTVRIQGDLQPLRITLKDWKP